MPRWDEETPLEETCGIMDDLVRQGKILYWGVSEWSAAQIRAAVALCRSRGPTLPSSDRPEYNALQRSVEREVLDAVVRLRAVAAEAGCTLSQLALAWCLRRPEVTSVIVAATAGRHVDENVTAADLELDPALFGAVEEVLDPATAPPLGG